MFINKILAQVLQTFVGFSQSGDHDGEEECEVAAVVQISMQRSGLLWVVTSLKEIEICIGNCQKRYADTHERIV